LKTKKGDQDAEKKKKKESVSTGSQREKIEPSSPADIVEDDLLGGEGNQP